MPQPFNQAEEAFTPTAQTIVIGADDEYSTDVLDNPVRAKINEALPYVNLYQWRHCGGWGGR